MRVISHIPDLLDYLGWDENKLADEIGIDPRSARKLIADKNWELRRETLHRLLLLGFEHGLERGVFEVRQHELWDTFRQAQASLFRADVTWDAKVEGRIRDFLAHLDCTPTLANSVESSEDIRNLVRTQNCVFIGSPKANRASEIVLALLDDATPFDTSTPNRDRLSLQFIGKSSEHKKGASAILAEGTSCAILIRSHDQRDQPLRVKVDWFSEEQFRGPARVGRDAAAVVVCRKPLGTHNEVTTIVICGYTGLATQQAAEDLMHGEPPISVDQLESAGVPIRIAHTFRFEKRAYRKQRNLDTLKVVVSESVQWLPHPKVAEKTKRTK